MNKFHTSINSIFLFEMKLILLSVALILVEIFSMHSFRRYFNKSIKKQLRKIAEFCKI